MKNHITLYSSGIGVLVRQADIAKGAVTPFRIPIKKSHRMDVIASLRVFGNGIKLQDSIGWPQDEKTQLTIDPTKVQESLLTQLSGRNIKFKPKQGQEATGINLGLQTQTEMLSDHRTVERPYVVIHVDKGGINRYALDQIDSLEFTEPEVNAEIVKAYQNNAAKVHEINTLNATSTRLLTTQKRLVGLIKEKAGAEQQIGKWQQEVGTTEEAIKKNETRLPKLEKERDQLQTALYDTIKALQAEWKGEPPAEAIVKN